MPFGMATSTGECVTVCPIEVGKATKLETRFRGALTSGHVTSTWTFLFLPRNQSEHSCFELPKHTADTCIALQSSSLPIRHSLTL